MARAFEKLLGKRNVGLQEYADQPVPRLRRFDDERAGGKAPVTHFAALPVADPTENDIVVERLNLDPATSEEVDEFGAV